MAIPAKRTTTNWAPALLKQQQDALAGSVERHSTAEV